MDLSQRIRMLVRLWKYRLREERDSIAFMRRQPLDGRTVVDIGANKGIYSYWMSQQVGPRGKVIAFEPQPELLTHLDEFKQSFGLTNLEIVGKGLSNRRGTVAMHRDKPGALGASLAVEQESAATIGSMESIDVEVVTLDEFCEEARTGPIAFIKCDVEGHELAVFEGARRTLQTDRPVLLFECHHHEAERGALFKFLTDLGYEGLFFERGSPHPYSHFRDVPYRKPTIRFRNYMFAHRDSPAAG